MAEMNLGVDQADRLRKIVNDLKERSDEIIKGTSAKTNSSARLIAVTSGKGGVGKTSFTANLAIELSRLGHNVIIIDGDLGLANIEVMLGIVPRYSLYEMIRYDVPLSEVLTEGPSGIKFISGGTGIMEMASLDRQRFQKILSSLSALDRYADFILIDTGAGISQNVINFLLAAHEIILVTNPEPTSITDSYAILKIVNNQNKKCDIKIVVNMVESASEADEILKRLSRAAERFLNVKIKNLGYIVEDQYVSRGIKLQKPFVLSYPKCNAAKNLQDIARRLAENEENVNNSEGVKSFLTRLYRTFSSMA